MNKNWQVYIILCSDNSFYTGITTDIERRFRQHAEGRGAKYFRGRHPIKVVYFETFLNRSSAARGELLIKAMSRAGKELLVSRQSEESIKAWSMEITTVGITTHNKGR